MDKFKELKNDMMFTPNAKRVVAVVRLKGPYPHPYRQGRCLEVMIFLSAGVGAPSVSVYLSVSLFQERRCVRFRLCLSVKKILCVVPSLYLSVCLKEDA